MSTDIAKNGPTGISTDFVNRLISGIAESRATTVLSGGKPLLRLLKDANWVYGQKDDQVQEGSWWAVNQLSIQHGWVAWTNHTGATKNTMVGEVMRPVFEPKPAMPAPVDSWPFSEQRILELKCMNGDDEGREVIYKASSRGGMQAVDKLLGELQIHLQENPAFPCPVIELHTDSYPHPKYGKTIIPIFELVDWASMEGELQDEDLDEGPAPAPVQATPKPEPAPAPAPAPTARRSRAAAPAAAAAPIAPPAPEEPAPTARRRPIRR